MTNRRLDPLSPSERSARMAKVRGKRNRSTEMRVAAKLAQAGIRGWKRHPEGLHGQPDFAFPEIRLVLFVDGCFWHMCPHCQRNLPRTRRGFWREKLDGNRRRDQRTNRILRRTGFHVMRVWECRLKNDAWLRRLESTIEKLRGSADQYS